MTKTKMKLNLNGVEIDLPNNAKVDVSKDGKSVKIELPEAKVVEKIRVIEKAIAAPVERIVEQIKVVEVEKPCYRPHYPTYPTWPTYPSPYTWTPSPYTWTISGGIQGNGSYTIGGVTYQQGNTIGCNGNIRSTN